MKLGKILIVILIISFFAPLFSQPQASLDDKITTINLFITTIYTTSMGLIIEYYHNDRTHYALEKDTPFSRDVQEKPDHMSKVIELPRVGGLHHRYEWRKAA